MAYWEGVILLIVGLAVSIALHELGHLIPAKLFGVYTPRYMIGFGPTLFSFRKGETEYGLKALPLGGYVRLAGMYPPGRPGRKTHKANGQLTMAEEARQAAAEDLPPGMEHRAFYALSVPKKLVIMAGGIFMNLVLSLICIAIALMGIGQTMPTTTVEALTYCLPAPQSLTQPDPSAPPTLPQVNPQPDKNGNCQEGAVLSPAAKAGLRPGDKILSWDGKNVSDWDALLVLIANSGGKAVNVEIERDGKRQTLQISSQVYTSGNVSRAVVGFAPQMARQSQSLAVVGATGWQMAKQTASVLLRLPIEIVKTTINLFQVEKERDPSGLIGIVGVGQIAGNIASAEHPDYGGAEKAGSFLMLFASLNMTLFLFNLIPLLPLDGGQVAGALWEAIRRPIRKARGLPDLGPVDLARALPLTMTMIGLLIFMTLILVAMDIAKPF